MEAKKETRQFKTEVQQLMNIIINSLYSHQEIFLRELISNASDAIDKLRFKAQTEPDILDADAEYKIKITVDKKKRTLEIADNGIGMTYDEVAENIGTIAKSGTASFLEAAAAAKKPELLTPEFIGQFGVGFYSAFIVASKITLVTRAAGSNKATRWVSAGDGSYTIEETKKDFRGTTVILSLKKAEKDEQDFTEEWTIRSIIKKHSDFVAYPILMDVERTEPVLDKEGKPDGSKTTKVVKEETLNSMKAIWTTDKKEISDEEYKEFYNHISHDWNPPLAHLHVKLEGATEYSALLYVPSRAPFDFFRQDQKHGIQLYSKRVFIMENCKELMPSYLAFVKGVVDAPDLNLNVSREILQQDALVKNIRKNLVKKTLELLGNLEKDKYEQFFKEFGSLLKSGISMDYDNRDKISALLRYQTTRSEGALISLADYVSRMQPDQDGIYYITGENLTTLLNSPHLELLKEKDYEVLLMTDPMDEWVLRDLHEYEKKPFKSAEKGDLDIGKQADDQKKDEYHALFEYIKTQLDAQVKEVKPSTHLKDSVACLSGDVNDMSAYLEKVLKATGQEQPPVKRVLELNMEHPLLAKIKTIFEDDKDAPLLKDYSDLLFDMAVIAGGGKIDNPSRFSKMIGDLMTNSLNATAGKG
ncbi:MAG: molecular chaperone HtpG [Deltaproteobacteria bacterium]|nr:molecular chaperone HtpG [Deltaproteobacteria bacterium]